MMNRLTFHVEQPRYIAIELKTGKFKPEHIIGQLQFYVALVDDRLDRIAHVAGGDSGVREPERARGLLRLGLVAGQRGGRPNLKRAQTHQRTRAASD